MRRPDKQLLRCARAGDVDGVETALESGACVDYMEGRAALHHAATLPDSSLVYLLLAYAADPNIRSTKQSEEGASPLHLAAFLGYEDVMRILLNGGADGEAVDSRGKRPVHWGALRGEVGVLAVLEGHGCDLGAGVRGGGNALHFAAASGSLEAVKWLLERGVSHKTTDRNRWLPKDVAKKNGHTHIHTFLRDLDKRRRKREMDTPPLPVPPTPPHYQERGVDVGVEGWESDPPPPTTTPSRQTPTKTTTPTKHKKWLGMKSRSTGVKSGLKMQVEELSEMLDEQERLLQVKDAEILSLQESIFAVQIEKTKLEEQRALCVGVRQDESQQRSSRIKLPGLCNGMIGEADRDRAGRKKNQERVREEGRERGEEEDVREEGERGREREGGREEGERMREVERAREQGESMGEVERARERDERVSELEEELEREREERGRDQVEFARQSEASETRLTQMQRALEAETRLRMSEREERDSQIAFLTAQLQDATHKLRKYGIRQRRALRKSSDFKDEFQMIGVPSGLPNLGNRCNINPVLQCLYAITAFRDYFTSDAYRDDLRSGRGRSEEGGEVAKSLAAVFKALSSGVEREIEAKVMHFKGVVNALGKEAADSRPHARFSAQSHAHSPAQFQAPSHHSSPHELLVCLLATLHTDLATASGGSFISGLFGLGQKRRMTCNRTGRTVSEVREEIYVVTLPITPDSPSKLSDALRREHQEKVVECECGNCSHPHSCLHHTTLTHLPTILVIHLHRMLCEGDESQITFPARHLTLPHHDSPSYELFAVVSQEGVVDSGRYTAFCRSPHDPTWRLYQDLTVTATSLQRVLAQTHAHVLFYRVSR